MNRSEQDPQTHATAGYRALIESQQTLLLSTVDAAGMPEISYAPALRDKDGSFAILVSELAAHTANLMRQGVASVMLIQPEAESRNLFARERVILRCRVTEVTAADARYESLLAGLEQRFGETVALLRTLPDFHLFSLVPVAGRYVMGFGQAYNVRLPEEQLVPVAKPD